MVVCGLTALASLVTEHRLWAQASVVVGHGLSCSSACGILPDQGSNPSSELAGGFLTTGPPGKSWVSFLMALIPARGLHPHDLITSQRTHLLIPGVCCCLAAKSCPTLFGPPQTIAHQAPLSMKFTRQEYETRVGCHFLFRGPS